MLELWIAALTMCIITLGFAGILGDLVYQLRSGPKAELAFLVLLLSSLVIFPPFSMPGNLQSPLWLAALIVAVVFAIRPARMPKYFLSRRFILQYACFALLTTAMWYLSVGPSLLMSFLTISALLAALFSWRESLDW